ncbi:hypothetical protein RJ639_023812 [Escallonia herrerae]|uniref:Cytochrome P450 n=1 Tax=Escallonia herrerae TaxID=1293975 RepID=A0AA89ADG9_9ASTE|nr:hypothetical protein RJ639_023812 [Escallonia herrerae]
MLHALHIVNTGYNCKTFGIRVCKRKMHTFLRPIREEEEADRIGENIITEHKVAATKNYDDEAYDLVDVLLDGKDEFALTTNNIKAVILVPENLHNTISHMKPLYYPPHTTLLIKFQLPSFSILLGFFLFVFMLLKIRNRSKTIDSTSNLPPGPWKLPFIGSMHHLSGSLPHHALRDLAKKHGPLMHLQLGEVSAVVVSSPETAEEVMKTHDVIFASRLHILVSKVIWYDSTDVAFAPYGEYWRQLRKICALELLSTKRVQSFRLSREEETSSVIASIASSCKPESPVNLTEAVYSHAFGTTSRAAFGKKSKDIEAFISLVKETTKAGAGFTVADVYPSIKLLHLISGVRRNVESLYQGIDNIFESIINEHRAKGLKGEGQAYKDLVDVLLQYQDGKNDFALTTDNIKAVIMDIFSAGRRRICLGMSFGLAVVELLLAKLLYHFDWKLPSGMKREELDMTKRFGATVRRKDDLYMQPKSSSPNTVFLMELQLPSFSILFAVTLFVFVLLRTRNRSKAIGSTPNLPPGPWKLPFIGSMHHLAGSLPHHALRDLANKHGSLMHLQLGEVSTVVVSSSETAKEVMKTHDVIFASRPHIIASNIICYDSTDIAFAPYGEYWRQLRKICALELLSSKRVESFRSLREAETSNLIRLIASECRTGSTINLTAKVYSHIFGTTSSAAFGKKSKSQEAFIALIKEAIKVAAGFNIADVYPSIKLLHLISGVKRNVEKLHQGLDMILEEIISEHREKATSKGQGQAYKDLVDVLLQFQDRNPDQIALTTDNVKAVILVGMHSTLNSARKKMNQVQAMLELLCRDRLCEHINCVGPRPHLPLKVA